MSSEMDEEQNEKLLLEEERRLRINKQKLSQVTFILIKLVVQILVQTLF